MYGAIKERLTEELGGIEAAGLFKNERVIMTPQDSPCPGRQTGRKF